MARRGFTITLKRLKPRAPDFTGPQIFGSKDNFQHFRKQLYLNFCFGSTNVFYYAVIKRSSVGGVGKFVQYKSHWQKTKNNSRKISL